MNPQLSLLKTMALACGAALLMVGVVLAVLGAPIAAQATPSATIQSMIDNAPDGGTVNIPSGTYTESLTVNKTLTLTGVSSTTTIIQAVSGQRVITVTAGHNLRLENLTVTGGHPSGIVGGGIFAASNLQIVNCRIANNSADYGGGVFQNDGTGRVDVIGSRIELNTTGNQGGGLYVSGNTALTNTQVLSNTAAGHGGGLHVQDGRADLNGGLFSNNAAGMNGGGINLNNGVSVSSTQFISNTAGQDGGGLLQYNSGQQVSVINAHFERNAAGGSGGGLLVYGNMALTGTLVYSNSAAVWGGGLLMGPARLTVHSSTFFGNTSYSGSGIALNSGTAQIDRSIVSGNSTATHGGGIDVWAARLKLTDVVVADNHANVGNGIYLYDSPLVDALHTTIARNSGGQGSGIYATCDRPSCGTVALTNTILVSHTVGITVTAGNTATLNGVLWFGNTANTGGAGATTVINAVTGAPAFAADGYHLTSVSKAINAGIAAGVAADIDGEMRDAAPDLGADEFRTCWVRLNNTSTDYGHVQAAVDASTLPADVVKVAGYCPGVQSRAGVAQTVYISKSLTMRGGYTTTNWTMSDPTANVTTLDALGRSRVVYLTGGSGVLAALENLTVRGGLFNGGGGVFNDGAQVTLANTVVRDNSAANTHGGGGILIWNSGILTMTSSLLTKNSASYGGGIFNNNGKLVLINSTLSENQSPTGSPEADGGGAINQWGASPNATIVNSTIVSNTAVTINVARSGIWLEAGTLTIQNSIVAHNGVTNNVRVDGGTFTSLGYNLTNSGAGMPFTATGDLVNTNPLLGPLQNNGPSTGSGQATWTHALLPGSPAIDRIPFGVNGCGTVITTDQRGQPRPGTFTHLCDIGAYEAQGIYYRVYLPVVIRQ